MEMLRTMGETKNGSGISGFFVYIPFYYLFSTNFRPFQGRVRRNVKKKVLKMKEKEFSAKNKVKVRKYCICPVLFSLNENDMKTEKKDFLTIIIILFFLWILFYLE